MSNRISQIKQILNTLDKNQSCSFGTYAFLQQPQTFDYIKYLKLSQQAETKEKQILSFNSQGDDFSKTNKKVKAFNFDGIYCHTQKMRYQCSKIIKQSTLKALAGQNQTFFVYGTEEKCKDKILFGQSQNPGIYVCVLSQLFDLCHEKGLEDNVTVKFSCSLFNNAKFMDVFGGNRDTDIQFIKDHIEGGILHTVPEIIIRNVKTGLKLLNIVLKKIADHREENFTQNLILTLKLQLDCKKIEDQTQIYCLSKMSFVKLANPSINSSLKGVNKNNVWFINLLNYIQNFGGSNPINIYQNQIDDIKGQKMDEFSTALRQTYFKNSHKIYGLISITNKMSSNECLTALLFSAHLRQLKIEPIKCVINIPRLNEQKSQLMDKILKSGLLSQQKLLLLWAQYFQLLEDYMSELNYLQFQYSLIIGQACERLNKYIFTQELQDFFYAKKMNVQTSQQLIQIFSNVKKIKNTIINSQRKIILQSGNKVDKQVLDRLFSLLFSMAHHFLLEEIQKVKQQIQKNLKQIERSKHQSGINKAITNAKLLQIYREQTKLLKAKQKQNIKNNTFHNQTKKQNQVQSKIFGANKQTLYNSFTKDALKIPKQTQLDNLQCMFKNKNVGILHKKSKASL